MNVFETSGKKVGDGDWWGIVACTWWSSKTKKQNFWWIVELHLVFFRLHNFHTDEIAKASLIVLIAASSVHLIDPILRDLKAHFPKRIRLRRGWPRKRNEKNIRRCFLKSSSCRNGTETWDQQLQRILMHNFHTHLSRQTCITLLSLRSAAAAIQGCWTNSTSSDCEMVNGLNLRTCKSRFIEPRVKMKQLATWASFFEVFILSSSFALRMLHVEYMLGYVSNHFLISERLARANEAGTTTTWHTS